MVNTTVNLEPHHRRIRRHASVIHAFLLPLAIAVPLLWIYFAYGACQDAESPWMLSVCSGLRFVPLLPALFGLAILALIVWELSRLGARHHAVTHGVPVPQPRVAHAVRGYRLIDRRHQHHVHWAAVQVVVVAIVLLVWLIFTAYHSTH